jgi:hypothetical protein
VEESGLFANINLALNKLAGANTPAYFGLEFTRCKLG